MVLTVASADNIKRVKIKGLETFVKSAEKFKEIEFVIVGIRGKAKEYLQEISPGNVKLVEFLQKEELLSFYQKAKVYCQLSISEGLPGVLCEAMLCECIPVGTNIKSIKSVMGNIGFYVDYGNVESTVDGIQKALNTQGNIEKKGRERIIKNFPMRRRECEIKKILFEMKK